MTPEDRARLLHAETLTVEVPDDEHPLVSAVQQVILSNANHATEGTLVQRVNRHMAAIDQCERVLRAQLSQEELSVLCGMLVDMHSDPLADDDQSLAHFMGDL
jgi:hypothetical protein